MYVCVYIYSEFKCILAECRILVFRSVLSAIDWMDQLPKLHNNFCHYVLILLLLLLH